MAFYVDTSALVKLIADEAETTAFQSWCAHHSQDLVASDLVRTELLRAAHRLSPAHVVVATTVLAAVRLTRVGERIFEQAGSLNPPSLRSLDTIHLASALDLGRDLEAMVTYDTKLAEAARQNAITVLSPGTS